MVRSFTIFNLIFILVVIYFSTIQTKDSASVELNSKTNSTIEKKLIDANSTKLKNMLHDSELAINTKMPNISEIYRLGRINIAFEENVPDGIKYSVVFQFHETDCKKSNYVLIDQCKIREKKLICFVEIQCKSPFEMNNLQTVICSKN